MLDWVGVKVMHNGGMLVKKELGSLRAFCSIGDAEANLIFRMHIRDGSGGG